MNRNRFVRLGPGAPSLILIFVVTSMAVLGTLSLMTSRNDLRLSMRYVEVTEAVYALMERGEETRAQLDALLEQCRSEASGAQDWYEVIEKALPAHIHLREDRLEWQEEAASRSLDCAVRILPFEEENRTVWIRHDLTTEMEDNSWN